MTTKRKQTALPTNGQRAQPSMADLLSRAAPLIDEALDLSGSEIACAVADEWALGFSRPERRRATAPDLAVALDRLEKITRPSALRKVGRS